MLLVVALMLLLAPMLWLTLVLLLMVELVPVPSAQQWPGCTHALSLELLLVCGAGGRSSRV